MQVNVSAPVPVKAPWRRCREWSECGPDRGRSAIDGVNGDIRASTGSGRIDVAVPVTVSGTIDRRSLRGTAHGGGPLLHVRTGSGSFQIR